MKNGSRPWYLLMWPGEEGGLMKMHVPADKTEVRLHHPKGHDVPFIALPFGDGKPAGGWYSYSQPGPVIMQWERGRFAETMLRFRQQYPRRADVLCFSAWYACIQEHIHGDALPIQLDLRRFDRRELLTGLTAGELNETIAAADPWAAVEKEEVKEKLMQVYNSGYGAGYDAGKYGSGGRREMGRKWILERNPGLYIDFDDDIMGELLLSCMESYRFHESGGNGRMMITVQPDGNWTMGYQEKKQLYR
jgi:hypothetical protein